MNKSLISVIIPVYNHAHTLSVCLSTLVWQAREQSLEVIIVNDGSIDDFDAVLNRLLQTHPDVKALNPKIMTQANQGAGVARNRGFEEATGEYVIFLDADTYCYPKMIERMRLALEKNLNVSFAYSQYRFGWKKMRSQPFDSEALKENNFIDTTSLIRKKALDGLAGPFDETLKRFQDWDLFLTMVEKGAQGIFVPEVLFQKIVKGRKGISYWLPSWFYRLPWKTKKVKEYEETKAIILKKHQL